MHNIIYASGFLYCPSTQQILLQQSSAPESSAWSLFRVEAAADNDPLKIIHAHIEKSLQKKISPSIFHPVYDYLDPNGEAHHHIFYVICGEDELFENTPELSWFTFKQITKTKLTPQAKQDLIVAQRVINAAVRAIEEATPISE